MECYGLDQDMGQLDPRRGQKSFIAKRNGSLETDAAPGSSAASPSCRPGWQKAVGEFDSGFYQPMGLACQQLDDRREQLQPNTVI
jgi:hypothetical protein